MTKCMNCGAELKSGLKFCEYCGTRAANIAEPHHSYQASENFPKNDTETSKQEETKLKEEKTKPFDSCDAASRTLRGPRGDLKKVPKGYCWGMLVWSVFSMGLLAFVVPLYRKDFFYAIWIFIINFILMVVFAANLEAAPATMIMIAAGAYEAYQYNEMYLNRLLKKGYHPILVGCQ